MTEGKILIVDDVPEMRTLLKAIVIKGGYSVEEASSGKDALIKVAAMKSLQLILLDIGLEDMTGYEFLEQISWLKNGTKFKVIFVTGKRDKADIVKAVQLGSDDYVVKPIDPAVLISKISNALNKGSHGKSFIKTNFEAKIINSPFEVVLRVVELSENMIVLESPMALSNSSAMELSVPKMDDLIGGGKTLSCKIVEVANAGAAYRAKANLIGLSDLAAKRIRVFVNSKRKLGETA